MVPPAVARYLADHGHGLVAGAEAVGGGCIANGRVIATTTGARFFLKTYPGAPAGMFEREAEGLAALAAAPGGPRVPRAFLAGPDYLLLEYLPPDRPAPDYWHALGQRLARLHLVTRKHFGFDHDNYIGLTPQPNPAESDGFRFFTEHRLLYLGRRCREQGLLDAGAMRQLERGAARLPELVPAQPASLLHGDLWSGNIIPGPQGQACVIDPACHYGWAEADLAMMVLFGSVPREFYAAYESVRPLTPGYRARFDVYNLYHLLNHLQLFGGGYREAAGDLLRRYGGR
jgi:fructosamine-3-kinase